jgi:hypothetical protein
MEPLVLMPDLLAESEALEYKARSGVADGELVVQCLRGKDRLRIDLSLSARIGKGLLGHAEVKARSDWVLKSQWEPLRFSVETSLWGMRRQSGFELRPGELDPLSAAFALRANPIRNLADTREFLTRDERRAKRIELYAVEKKREANAVLGEIEAIKLGFREKDREGARPDAWGLWVDSRDNVLVEVEVGHERLGSLRFFLSGRHRNGPS